MLPAIDRQQGNFQEDALRTHLHPLQLREREGPTIPSKSPQKLHTWLPQWQPKLPKTLLPLQQAGPTAPSDTDFRVTAPLPPDHSDHQCTATILQVISRTSTTTTQPTEVQSSRSGPTLHQREPWAPFCPTAAAASSAKDTLREPLVRILPHQSTQGDASSEAGRHTAVL